MTVSIEKRSTCEAASASRGEQCVSHINTTTPTYAGLFRCIGAACEDICCVVWNIPLDKQTYERYMALDDEELTPLIAQYVHVIPNATHDTAFAILQQMDEGTCAFLQCDKQCAIHAKHGPAWLSTTCSLYPRALNVVGGKLEGLLSLSCPEAARFVLLREDALERKSELRSGAFRTDNVFSPRKRWADPAIYIAVREAMVRVVRDRSRSLRQRLLFVVELCARLDAAQRDGVSPLDVLHGTGCDDFVRMQGDTFMRLELAIVLSDARRRDPECGRRFRDVFAKFVEGVGAPGGGTPEEAVKRFDKASVGYFLPYVRSFPFVLENYLLNWMYQHLFPFGREGSAWFVQRTMREEALVTQFSWLTTLLTGVSGRYRREFSHAHVVEVVQSFTRAVEHAPEVANDALSYVQAHGLDSSAALAALLGFRGEP